MVLIDFDFDSEDYDGYYDDLFSDSNKQENNSTKVSSLWHWVRQQYYHYFKKDKYFGYTPEEFVKQVAEVQWGGLHERIENESLDESGIHAYLRHIPIRGIHNGWPKEIYELSDPCIHALYEYSKDKGFIPQEYTLEDFLKSHNIL